MYVGALLPLLSFSLPCLTYCDCVGIAFLIAYTYRITGERSMRWRWKLCLLVCYFSISLIVCMYMYIHCLAVVASVFSCQLVWTRVFSWFVISGLLYSVYIYMYSVAWQPNSSKQISSHKKHGDVKGVEQWIQVATKYEIVISSDTWGTWCMGE